MIPIFLKYPAIKMAPSITAHIPRKKIQVRNALGNKSMLTLQIGQICIQPFLSLSASFWHQYSCLLPLLLEETFQRNSGRIARLYLLQYSMGMGPDSQDMLP